MGQNNQAATGNSTTIALGLERSCGIPGGAIVAYNAILPTALELAHAESEDPAINPSGFARPGLPGAIAGPADVAYSLTTGHLLEFLFHLFGGATKDQPEAGVHRYVFDALPLGLRNESTFWGLFAKEPVSKFYAQNVAFSGLELTVGQNEAIPARLTGAVGHGSEYAVEPDVGNTGTYSAGPWVRGPLKDESVGDVYLRVTQVAPTLQFSVEQTAGVPAFPGSAVDVLLDADGDGAWQNLQDQDGIDLGIWDENRDPLEVVWPGTVTDHQTLAVGDTFRVRIDWALPALPSITGFNRMTSAHWVVRTREVGAPSWIETPVQSGTVTVSVPMEPQPTNRSRYVAQHLRDGSFVPTLALERELVSRFFSQRLSRHRRIEMEMAFEGKQLGTGQYRDSILLKYPSVGITGAAAPVSNAGIITEALGLRGEADDAGSPPLTVTVITERDWTPPA